jgi:acyl carrier protein
VNVDEASPAVVLREISGILRRVREEYELADVVEITMDTRFQEDLELESIDLVELAGHLDARYGNQVNFAEFIADLELEEIIQLDIGRLVDFVVACLRPAPSDGEAVATADEER